MILKVVDGAYSYDKKDFLYKNVNFDVSSGEILCVLGVNGCGKTTLLKCIMNLLEFTNGKALIDDEDIKDNKHLFKVISYVPQSKSVFSSLSALDMVLLGLCPNMNFLEEPKQKDIEKAINTLKELDILYLKDKLCNEISGGELQMVLIARAIVSEPKILVMDEPESNLDFKKQLLILSKIKELTKTKKIICIINTHYPDHAYKISNKILMINKYKKSCLFGKTNEIMTEDNLKEVFGVDVLVKEFNDKGRNFKVVLPFME